MFRRINVLVSEFSIFNYFYVPQGPPGLPGLGGPKGEKVSGWFTCKPIDYTKRVISQASLDNVKPTRLKDAFWKHIKQPLSLSPPPHPVVREKSEDLAKRWASPINHFIFSTKWIYSKMRCAASARMLAVTQSNARAWMCSARNCTPVQPWQGTSEPHRQDAMHAERATDRTGLPWLSLTQHHTSQVEAPPSLLESTQLYSQILRKEATPPPKKGWVAVIDQ